MPAGAVDNDRRVSRTTMRVIAICWVTIIFDGYDLIVYGAVVPDLLEYQQWSLSPEEAGTIGSYALFGMLVGALIAGTITDLVGRRRIILFCIAWFSLAMGLCAIAPSPELFGFFRFLAGLGLGGVVPTASAITIEILQWTPDQFWPAHSPISVTAEGFSTSFETGSAVVGVADLDAHTFTVSIDDQVVRQMPASMGKPKHPTPVGTFTALEKQSPVIMDSRTIGIPLSDPEGYKLTVYDAVRVTWGGVYVHSAPWSTGSQGNSNVSHGCINLSPDNAAWYYDTVRIGDPIIVQA